MEFRQPQIFSKIDSNLFKNTLKPLLIAVDDDQIYPNSLIKDLVQGSRKHPSCIIGRDVRIPHIIDNIISPVSNWHLSGLHILDLGREIPPTVNLMPEGIGGILSLPIAFILIYLKEIFFDLCPH